jgi:hypothetical protein
MVPGARLVKRTARPGEAGLRFSGLETRFI